MRRAFLLCSVIAACSTFGESADKTTPEAGADGTDGAGGTDGGTDAIAAPDVPTTDAGSDGPLDPGKLVFITKAELPMSPAFATQANALCMAEGAKARPGATFVAWLSTPSTNAIDGLPNEGVWKLANGKDVIFPTRGSLTAQMLPHKIDEHADGAGVPSTEQVWTNTRGNGTRKTTDAGFDCQGLTSASASFFARVGNPTVALNAGWTDNKDLGCDKTAAIICFEK